MKIIDLLQRPFGATDAKCPTEASVLAYSENKLSSGNRVQVERHFAGCDDCRELLAFMGRYADEMTAPVSQEDVLEQTDKVLGYIRNDELSRTRSAQKTRAAGGFYVSYPKLATVGLAICAMLAGSVFLLTRGQSPADVAMEAIKLGSKDQRRTEARLSGEFEYSPYINRATRGDAANEDNLQFDRAVSSLSSAQDADAPVKNTLIMAKAYIARGTPQDVDHGLKILINLRERGVETAEVFNDTGVAHLQLGHYDKAIECFTRALAMASDHDEFLFNKALAEQLFHRDDDARRDWQQFIEKSSDYNWKTEASRNLSSLATSNR